ncbi:MAG: hypothetical protein ACFFC7_09035 [Candidatus Hermodarchaeota archaeon]
MVTIGALFREWVTPTSPLVSNHKPATSPGNPPALAGGGRQLNAYILQTKRGYRRCYSPVREVDRLFSSLDWSWVVEGAI